MRQTVLLEPASDMPSVQKINGWDLTQYNRIKDLPQSELSLFYFNRVLGIGEMGFRVPPTIV